MFERTLTMSSAGKTFSTTGWKVGWAIGPDDLIKKMTDLQQWVNFSSPSVTQDTIARCLKRAREPYEEFPTFYDWLAADYKKRRGVLEAALTSAGISPIRYDAAKTNLNHLYAILTR